MSRAFGTYVSFSRKALVTGACHVEVVGWERELGRTVTGACHVEVMGWERGLGRTVTEV